MGKKILFAIIPLILSIGLLPVLPFSDAAINEDSECREDRVLVYRVSYKTYGKA